MQRFDKALECMQRCRQDIADRYLPDKAVDLIDEAATRCRIDGKENHRRGYSKTVENGQVFLLVRL